MHKTVPVSPQPGTDEVISVILQACHTIIFQIYDQPEFQNMATELHVEFSFAHSDEEMILPDFIRFFHVLNALLLIQDADDDCVSPRITPDCKMVFAHSLLRSYSFVWEGESLAEQTDTKFISEFYPLLIRLRERFENKFDRNLRDAL